MSQLLTISVLGGGIPSDVGDTDPSVPILIASYMNAGLKDAKADKFKLASGLDRVGIYFDCNATKSTKLL